MIEAVLVFGLLLSLFEFVLLSMITPKYRLRLLGSRAWSNATHMGMLLINIWMHWGTVTGMMSATGAFVTSIVTVEVARMMYGTITDGVRTRRGLLGYKNAELML